MNTLRRRIPFKLDGEEEVDADGVLDEQRVFISICATVSLIIFCPEQDEVIDRLRRENDVVNRIYSIALKFVVSVSFILCVFEYPGRLPSNSTQTAGDIQEQPSPGYIPHTRRTRTIYTAPSDFHYLVSFHSP